MPDPVFKDIPLGEPIPGKSHSVSVSLPTMADVIGYEEDNPDVRSKVFTGYPRFVIHPLLKAFTSEFARRHKARDLDTWLVNSPLLAHEMVEYLGIAEARIVREGSITGVFLPKDPALSRRAKQFLQHTGGFLSSRQAEDALVNAGLVPKPEPEQTALGNPMRALVSALLPLFDGALERDLLVFPNGMNAFHAAFSTINSLHSAGQQNEGRTAWLQVGWLYLDTIEIFKKFTQNPSTDHVFIRNPTDTDAIRKVFENDGDRLAGVVIEVPSNPLVQTPDVAVIAELCRGHGVPLVIDISVSSPFNVDVLPYADVVVSSLTKYCACEGDLVLGCTVVNPEGPFAAHLRTGLAARHVTPYHRDLARLAFEIRETPGIIAAINANTARVVEFLRSRPEIAKVHWALQESSAKNYLTVARTPSSAGCIVSFELRVRGLPGLAAFYDRVRLPKGPSFGMKTTLLSPHMYLAHYDLISKAEERAELERDGPHPELLRLSVGTEPVEAIIAELGAALDAPPARRGA